MRAAYKVRAYPDPGQAALLSLTFGCVRVVWNHTLADRARRYTVEKQQQALRHQHTAFAAFFARRGRYPRFKSRRGRQSAHFTRSAFRIKPNGLWRAKALVKVARAHARVRDARRDFLHKTSTALVRRFDRVGVEDLPVPNMVRNHSLARAISQCGWAQFRAMLEYKAERAGRQVVIINRWNPSSKTCSNCGHLLTSLTLGTRHWTCPGCGTRHDRDHNAAKNIDTAAGPAVAACGADVRPRRTTARQSAAKQEHPPARVGTPRL